MGQQSFHTPSFSNESLWTKMVHPLLRFPEDVTAPPKDASHGVCSWRWRISFFFPWGKNCCGKCSTTVLTFEPLNIVGKNPWTPPKLMGNYTWKQHETTKFHVKLWNTLRFDDWEMLNTSFFPWSFKLCMWIYQEELKWFSQQKWEMNQQEGMVPSGVIFFIDDAKTTIHGEKCGCISLAVFGSWYDLIGATEVQIEAVLTTDIFTHFRTCQDSADSLCV